MSLRQGNNGEPLMGSELRTDRLQIRRATH